VNFVDLLSGSRSGFLEFEKIVSRAQENSPRIETSQTQLQPISETFPKPISSFGIEKTKPNTTKAHIHQSKEMYYNTK